MHGASHEWMVQVMYQRAMEGAMDQGAMDYLSLAPLS